MQMPKRLVFWEPTISPHKIHFFEKIKLLYPDIELIICANQDIGESRKNLGWKSITSSSVSVILAPNHDKIHAIISEDTRTSVHIFSGIRWFYNIKVALKFLKKTDIPFIIMSEPRVIEGMVGKFRVIHSWLTERWFRKKARAVLAIGANGPKWYETVGYKNNKIYPFAYFIDESNIAKVKQADRNFIKVSYIGRLTKMKGVQYLLEAVFLSRSKIHLSIVGVGEEESSLKNLAKKLSLNAEFLGTIDMNEIQTFISTQDVVVLPSLSTDDGWGVVVSEALICGTSVVATNEVGASIILDNKIRGMKIKSHSAKSIIKAIENLDNNNAFSEHQRIMKAEWASRSITSSAGAVYFMEILEHVFINKQRPNPFYIKDMEKK